MASARNINITVKVTDGATAKMRNVETQMKKMGKSTEQLNNNFLKFNRTLFTTTAFIGTFVAAFKGLTSAITTGVDFERVENNFERIFGKNSNVVNSISKFTDTVIDRTEAMQAAVQMANLGVVSNLTEASSILAKAGVAARMNGKAASEGIQAVTKALETGDVAVLRTTGIMSAADEQYLVTKGVLGKVGGAITGLIQKKAALRIITERLTSKTKDFMFGQMDLKDTVALLSRGFGTLKSRVGIFLAHVFSPMIIKFANFAENLAESIRNIQKINPEFMAMAKIAGFSAVAIAGLVATLGTLKLMTIALASTGFGLPALISLVLIGAGVFKSITNSVDSVNERLKVFSAFVKGVYQLLSSFNKETGISKLDKDLEDLLRKHGILDLAKNIARVSIVVKNFVTDVGSTLISWGKTAFTWINKLTDAFKSFMGVDSGPWSRSWIEGMDGVRGTLVKLVAGFVAFKALKGIFGSVISNIPGLGGMFGGGVNRGSSPTNPMFTKEVGLGGAAGVGLASAGALGSIAKTIKDWLVSDLKKGVIFKALSPAFAFISSKLMAFGMLLKLWTVSLMTTLKFSLIPKLLLLGKVLLPLLAIVAAFTAGRKIGQYLDEKFIAPLWQQKGSETGTQVATKSQVSTPYSYEDELAKVDDIGQQISNIKDDTQRRGAQAMMEAFLSKDSEGGASITEAERQMLDGTFEMLQQLKDINNNTKPEAKTPIGSRRGF